MEVLHLLYFLSPLLISAHKTNALSIIGQPVFEAIYQFGDSISDTGNQIRQGTGHLQCATPPYGETFFHYPTGRCSDGLIMIDYFAQAFNLPFLDPYLDEQGNFTHGVNFAVSGATALNSSTLAAKDIPSIYTNNSLLLQLDWFKSHLNVVNSDTPPSELKKKLGKALFLVGEIGGNDYKYAAVMRGQTMEELRALVPEVIQTIVHVVEELIDLGAKQIVVPGNFPVGCMTLYLRLFKSDDPTIYDDLNCLRSWNEFSSFHNDRLQLAVRGLQSKYPDVVIVYGDYYTALRSILKNAPSLGFENGLLTACCGSSGSNYYDIDAYKPCGSNGAPLCLDPSKRVSWDGVHLTQRTYQLMANWLLKDIFPRRIQVA